MTAIGAKFPGRGGATLRLRRGAAFNVGVVLATLTSMGVALAADALGDRLHGVMLQRLLGQSGSAIPLAEAIVSAISNSVVGLFAFWVALLLRGACIVAGRYRYQFNHHVEQFTFLALLLAAYVSWFAAVAARLAIWG